MTSSQHSALYALVDWLILGGVSVETGEISTYDANHKRLAERSQTIEPTAAVTKPTSSTSKPLQSEHRLKEFKSMQELNEFCFSWKDFSLARTAAKPVVGTGSLAPLLYVVTDMPEDEEDRTGDAFTGAANQIIRKALSFADIPEDKIFFSYLSKWRSPGKRSLSSHELNACSTLLQQEIRLLAPRFLLVLGESSRDIFIKSVDVNDNVKFPFGKIHSSQMFNKECVILTSQKPEFLIKNPLMKKNFWFGLLELADLIRADGRSHLHNPGVNNVEQNSDVL